jgi:predicted DsbA family dithiol-disulfide isomerase
MSPFPIDMVSDVVCPWCYVGKRHLEKAIALKPEIPVAVRFRPYLLNPWVPREGMSREDYLVAKFGSVERYNANSQRIIDIAAAAGLDYARDKIKRQPNTIDCHRLIAWAPDPAGMKQRLMQLYFSEGGDLTDREVLVKAAADCGMDADDARRRLATDEDVARIEAEARSASEAGIQGVPYFIFGNVLAVNGAQPPDYLAQAIERAADEVAKRVAAE